MPGQNASLTFTGTAGQRISLGIVSTVTLTKLSITGPSGTTLVAPLFITSAGGFIDTKTLPLSGTYTIMVDPQTTYTGSLTLTLYDVPANVSSTITPGGSPASVTLGTPGQNATLTFTGTAGQRASLRLTNDTIGNSIFAGTQVSVLKPDGTALIPATGVNTNGTFFDTRTLPVSGTYSILVDPVAANTGGMTLTLY